MHTFAAANLSAIKFQVLLDGQLAWRQPDGGNTDAPNLRYFIQCADQFIGHPKTP